MIGERMGHERLGLKLRHYRHARGLTLQQLADLTGCSESMLSKVEKMRVNPSLTLLRRVAEALAINVAVLFGDIEEDGVVSRAKTRPRLGRNSLRGGDGITLERLVPHSPGALLQANIHTVDAGGASDGLIEHLGEEMGYILEGEIELSIDGDLHVLRPGDSFYFRSERPHGYRNIGTVPARILWVNTPPTF